MNSVKATKWLTELNISDKNPFEYNSVTKKFWCKPCKKVIQKIPGKKGKQVQAKLDYVLGKNQGEKVLREFANIIKGEQGNIPNGWSASDVADMNYAPVQSVDVEKSFSIYKNILTERRHSLTEENLGKMMVCNCYYNRK